MNEEKVIQDMIAVFKEGNEQKFRLTCKNKTIHSRKIYAVQLYINHCFNRGIEYSDEIDFDSITYENVKWIVNGEYGILHSIAKHTDKFYNQ